MICPYYSRVAFDLYRCMGANLAGKCGHPTKVCPIKQQTIMATEAHR